MSQCKHIIICFLSTFLSCELVHANAPTVPRGPLYAGIMGGYGSTTWEGLVPTRENQNYAINISTPVKATEGGGVWGALAGYELTPNVALEGNYIHYPHATIRFDSMSLFSFDHNGLNEFSTSTETLSLMGKLMVYIPNTKVRLFSSAGIGGIHRKDIILDDWRLSPSFGVGFNYDFTHHLMWEFGANYTAGYGESQLNPTDAYFPFLYSITFRLVYYFSQ